MMPLFALMAAIIVISSLGVVLQKNPVYSALWLVTNLLTIAALFATLNAHFLAVAQVIVYAGAIMVLFVFVIMLLNLKEERNEHHLIGKILSWAVGIGCVAIFIGIFNAVFRVGVEAPLDIEVTDAVQGTTAEIGKLLYTQYLFPFEAASLLIIAAIVGAVMLAKRKKTGAHLPPQFGGNK